jgi:MFS family permease
MLQIGNIIQSFGYFLPSTYLASYTTSTIGLSPTMGTLMISLFSASSVIGGIILGHACDKFNVTNVMLVSSVGSALSVWLFWGLSMPVPNTTTSSPASSSLPSGGGSSSSPATAISLLVLFSLFYGFFAGGFSSTWSGVLTQLKAESPSLETGFMFGLLAGGRGIGNVISGPLSAVLLSAYAGSASSKGTGEMKAANGYDSQYGAVIVFTGVTALLGGWSWLWGVLRKVLKVVTRII